MTWERIYYKSLKVSYLKTQCRRHWMKEGTVSSGVALRPRPTEVQPHFLGSKWLENYLDFLIFVSVTFAYWLLLPYYFSSSLLYIDFCYQIILISHFCILTSVTKFLFQVTFAYWLLLPNSYFRSLLYIDFCYQIIVWVTFVYRLLLPSIKYQAIFKATNCI